MAGMRGIGTVAIGEAISPKIFYHLFNLPAVFDKNSQSTAVFDKTKAIAVIIEE